MARVLVAYGSKRGGTARIAEQVTDILRRRGHDVALTPAGEVPRRESFDAAVVGSALYAGRWRGEAVRLLRRLTGAKAPVRVWLFHSGPLGDEAAGELQPVPKKVRALADRLGVREVATFGGRLAEAPGGFIAGAMARNGKAGDWRDWDAIAAWAGGIADALEGS